MDNIYIKIRDRAREIAGQFPAPDFYRDFSWANKLSCHFFDTDPVIARVLEFVEKHIQNNLGHGMEHAIKVALDAGALLAVEGKRAGYSDDYLIRRVLVVQCAGLLHDIKRVHANHAVEGSVFAREILKAYPVFNHEEVDHICQAMWNHEAFKSTVGISAPEGVLVSDCLYDADKFRWGADNFTHTVWNMLICTQTPVSEFIKCYQNGIDGIAKIKTTFRTHTGKQYGPQFIDIGLAIGKDLYAILKVEFSECAD